MSQHIVEKDNKKWVFGWDQPLQTFYLQYHDHSLPEEERIILWLGTGPQNTIYEVDDLVQKASETGLEIDLKTQGYLYREKDEGL